MGTNFHSIRTAGDIYMWLTPVDVRLGSVEDKHVSSLRFITINGPGTSGTLTPPANSTIQLDSFGGTTDAVVAAMSGGRPGSTSAVDTTGEIVAATLDALGNWTLVGTPSSFPVALIYRVSQKLKDFDDVSTDIIHPLTIESYGMRVYDSLVAFNGVETTKDIDVSSQIHDARIARWMLLDVGDDNLEVQCPIRKPDAATVRITTAAPLAAGNYRLVGLEPVY